MGAITILHDGWQTPYSSVILNTDLGEPSMSDEELVHIYLQFLGQGEEFDDVKKWQLRRVGNTIFFPMSKFFFFFFFFVFVKRYQITMCRQVRAQRRSAEARWRSPGNPFYNVGGGGGNARGACRFKIHVGIANDWIAGGSEREHSSRIKILCLCVHKYLNGRCKATQTDLGDQCNRSKRSKPPSRTESCARKNKADKSETPGT